jgi:transposase
MVKRQRFTAEFKREAVRLLDAGERPASELAIDLGIRRNQLYKWKADLVRSGEVSFPGSGRKADQDSEIVRLKHELASNQNWTTDDARADGLSRQISEESQNATTPPGVSNEKTPVMHDLFCRAAAGWL